MIAVSFEASGDPGPARPILDALRAAEVRATFFLDGRWAEEHPDLVRCMAGDGHELGNHGYDHPDWTELDDAAIVADLRAAEDAVERLAGLAPRPWARPPYGAVDARVLSVLESAGYRVVYRDAVDGGHWPGETTPVTIRERARQSAVDGGLIVFHTDREATAEALPGLLAELTANGHRLGTLTDLGSVPSPRLELHPDFADLEVRTGNIRPLAAGRWRSLNVLEMGAGARRPVNAPETVAEVDGAALQLLTGDASAPFEAELADEDRHLLVLAGELRCGLRDGAGAKLGHILARPGDLVLIPAGSAASITCSRRWTGLALTGSEHRLL